MQQAHEIASNKLDNRQKELDTTRSKNVNLESQLETLTSEIKTLQSRLEGSLKFRILLLTKSFKHDRATRSSKRVLVYPQSMIALVENTGHNQ